MNSNIIDCPDHYVKGRKIEPIDVIEKFGLCHHLACVVKYIARAGRKGDVLLDLQKAEWYLEREGAASCSPPLAKSPLFTIKDICEDWKISPHLEEVLVCSLLPSILPTYAAHEHRFLPLRAMEHLRLEIFNYERE